MGLAQFGGYNAQPVIIIDSSGAVVSAFASATGVDRASFSEGVGSANIMAGVRNDTVTADIDEDEIGTVRVTPKGDLLVNPRNVSGVEIFTVANPAIVDLAGALSHQGDSIQAVWTTDKISNNGTALTPKFKVIDHAVSGDNEIVALVASKKIRVLSMAFVVAAAVTVRFESGAGGTALTGQMQFAANGGISLPANPFGWFETASGVALNMELSGATSVDGMLVYAEV